MSADHSLFTARNHKVLPQWIDAYGHMNMAKYVELLDTVCFDLLDAVDLGLPYTERTGFGLFTVDVSISYFKELRGDAPLEISLRLMDVDHIRLHSCLELRHATEGFVAARMEQLAVHASLKSRSALRFEPDVRERLADAVALHRQLPLPEGFKPRLACAPRG